MGKCPYLHPQANSKSYNILNKTRNFRESIKSWNCHPLIHKMWIAFKTKFRESHIELNETGKLTFGKAGYGQSNIVEDIVSRLSVEFQHQAKMLNSAPTKYPAPPISGTAELLQQVLIQNQESMRLLSDKYGDSGRNNTNRPPTPSAGTC